MGRKRIVIFSLAYYPRHVGGAEVAIKEITDRFPTELFDVHLITNRFDSALPKEERIGNVVVHRVGFGRTGAKTGDTHSSLFYLAKILFVPLAALKADALHREELFDGAWAMMSYMLFPLILARFMGLRVPYALTLQEGDPFEHVFTRPHIKLFRPLLRYGFTHANVVQCISSFLADWARQMGVRAPVVVIPNGVDVEHFGTQSDIHTLAHTSEALGKRVGETWLIHTGRYVHKNGLDTVIRALTTLPDTVHLLLLGEGPLKEELHALVRSLSVEGRVHFHPYVPLKEIVQYLHACDIFIRPSRSEGMGNSFIEAMAAGLPVIATQEGGISDFLFDAHRNPDKPTTGWAVDSDTPEQVAQAVRYIMDHADEARRITVNARALVESAYDWDFIAERMRREVFDFTLKV